MRIDVHGHIGTCESHSSDLQHVTAYLDTCAVQRLLVSNLDAAGGAAAHCTDETAANLATLEACRQDRRLLPVYWVRLGQEDSKIQAFAGAFEVEPFVAAFFSPPRDEYAADDARLDPHLSVLAKLRRAAFIEVGPKPPHDVEHVYTLARRHPGLPIVLCGAGGQPHWDEVVETVARSRDKQEVRLYLATDSAAAADIAAAFERLGRGRLMFGSDAARLGAEHGPRFRELLSRLPKLLGDEGFADLAGNAAQRVFPLV